jgi:hypothetical protein
LKSTGYWDAFDKSTEIVVGELLLERVDLIVKARDFGGIEGGFSKTTPKIPTTTTRINVIKTTFFILYLV